MVAAAADVVNDKLGLLQPYATDIFALLSYIYELLSVKVLWINQTDYRLVKKVTRSPLFERGRSQYGSNVRST